MAIITISRGTFSGGEKLAECLSKRLGYRTISREVLVLAATMFEAPELELVKAIEEKTSLKERLRLKNTDRLKYLLYIQSALCEEAKKDNLIYTGHAGHVLLKGVSHVLKVKVIAPLEQRIEFIMERDKLSREEAKKYIHDKDKQRKQWTKFLYNIDWNEPLSYDIVVNLKKITIPAACETIAVLAGTLPFKTTEASYKAMNNLVMATRAKAALAYDETTKGYAINVEADDGVVTLTGKVNNMQEIDAVEKVVSNVPDVKDVKCKCTFYYPKDI
jgi:cytidylate kinase